MPTVGLNALAEVDIGLCPLLLEEQGRSLYERIVGSVISSGESGTSGPGGSSVEILGCLSRCWRERNFSS